MRAVNAITIGAPFRWLAQGLRDLFTAPFPCLLYGAGVAIVSFGIWRALLQSNLAFWALSLSCGFVFVAPILAMGLYEAGHALEHKQRPQLWRMLFVRDALRADVFYLGLALLLIYLLWGRVAQVVYGLSTYHLHTTVEAFYRFALGSSEGHAMLISGAIVGGVMAFFTFTIVVVSTPMLLDRDASIFEAMFTSFRAVATNFLPLLLWAAMIALLLLASAATAWLALVFVFPWLGLASWRAYRAIVADAPAARAAAGQ